MGGALMQVRVLGSAAGGGYPQWNCDCPGCTAARDPSVAATPRTQSSLAIRADGDRWFLFNASPDLREQLSRLPRDDSDGLRFSPVAAVVLSDAEIDHTAGLLLLRESNAPLEVYSSVEVRDALTTHYPVLEMLQSYCGLNWHELAVGVPVQLNAALEVEMFTTGGDAPLYMPRTSAMSATGFTIRDLETGGVLTYAPGLERIDAAIAERLRASDCVIVDGTFWQRDELVSLGLSKRDAFAMGHQPLWGPDGSLGVLEDLPGRTILAHINNTNPILREDSPERALLAERGIAVAFDGMEIDL